jgi:hypothetical protein
VQQFRSDPAAWARVGVFFVAGLIFLAVSLPWVLAGWSSRGLSLFAVFGIPFVLVGAGMVGWSLWVAAIRPLVVGHYLDPAEIALSKDMLRVGEAFTVRYRQAVRRDLRINQVTVQLLMTESARYRRGTDDYTVTHHHIVQEFTSEGRRLYARDQLAEDRELRIPRDAMHSFGSDHNRLEWVVRIAVDLPTAPNVLEVREIMVLPQLAARDDDGRSV